MTTPKLATLLSLLWGLPAHAGLVEDLTEAEADVRFLVDGRTCTRSVFLAAAVDEVLHGDSAEREAALVTLAEGLSCMSAYDYVQLSEALVHELAAPAETPEALLPLAVLWSDVGRHGPMGEALQHWLITEADELEPLLAAGHPLYGFTGGQVVALDPEVALGWYLDFVDYGDHALGCGILEQFEVAGHRVCEWDCGRAEGDERLPAEVVAACTQAVDDTMATPGWAWAAMPDLATCALEHASPSGTPCLVERQLERAIQPLARLGVPAADRFVVSRDCQLTQDHRTDEELDKDIEYHKKLETELFNAWFDRCFDQPPDRLCRSLDEKWRFHMREHHDAKEEKDRRANGGQTQLCDPNAPSGCSTTCGIQDQTLQDVQACYDEEHGEPLPEPTPDPADPRVILVDPLVPPQAEEGFLSCVQEATTPDEGTCDDALDCANGEEPVEEQGLCVCPSDEVAFDPHERCQQAMDCLPDQPCTCEIGAVDVPFGPDGLPVGPGTFRFFSSGR